MELTDKIYIAGHRGMVGSALVRKLTVLGYRNLVLKNSSELDLRDQADVRAFFNAERPDFVFLAAAKVGGILANNRYRAEFLYDNLMIQSNIIDAAYRSNVQKLLFLGSSCIYPKLAPQPLTEDALLSGFLEPTNEPYAIAKIAGIKLCDAYRDQYGCNFIAAMPTNLYGPNDNYDLTNSHVLPALLRKFIEAKRANLDRVVVWGSGTPLREFMHVDDLADACFFLMQQVNERGFVNVGVGTDLSIKDLAQLIQRVTGFAGELDFDASKPDGTPRKLMNVEKLRALGWQAKISLDTGIRAVFADVEHRQFD